MPIMDIIWPLIFTNVTVVMVGLQQLEFIGSCLSSALPFSDLVCALLYPGAERLTVDDRDDDNLVRRTGSKDP